MTQGGVSANDFEPTLATLREGVTQVAIDRAVAEVDGWEATLRGADDRVLTPVADNLAALSTELRRDPLDAVTVGGLLRRLAGQTRHVASEGTAAESAAPIAVKLEQLAELLQTEGDSFPNT